jgi:hypothetical protein
MQLYIRLGSGRKGIFLEKGMGFLHIDISLLIVLGTCVYGFFCAHTFHMN